MTKRIYASDAAIVEKIHAHFEREYARCGGSTGRPVAAPPPPSALEQAINAAFWTSLRNEEGYPVKISLAYMPPGQSDHPFELERPLRLIPRDLAKLAPAVERPGIHLGAWPDEQGELWIWGSTRTVPALCFVVEVAGPGLLVVKHRSRGRFSKFVNVAVLSGDEAKLIGDPSGVNFDCLSLLTSLFGRDTSSDASWQGLGNVFVQLAISMRAHQRGGTLLVVPAESSAWRESVTSPLLYEARQPFTELQEAARHAVGEGARRRDRISLTRVVDAVAGLTAVDGATLMTESLELLGFGARIVRRKGMSVVERVLVSEPVEGGEVSEEHPSALGGTRHLSAAQFVQDQPDSLALVASTDGRFTVFAWSRCDELVHAHRIDALLM